MRLDLFLKTSRLIKRRVTAREMCDGGRVLLNGHDAKPAREVKPGDMLTIQFPSRIIELEVLVAPETGKKIPREEIYRITSEKRLPKEDLWNENLS